MKIGLIGYGYWGANLARCLNKLGVLSAVCDCDDKLAEVAERYDVSLYDDLGRLWASDVDAVVIATPSATHYTIAKSALEAGKDVFVEKPMALRVSEGELLVELAEAKKQVLMVGHVMEYHPAVVKLKEMVDAGELGNLRYIYSERLNWGKFRTEENILWSFAPHDISLMLLLTGRMPTWAVCRGGDYLNPDIADVTVSIFDFGDGLKGHIFVNWLHPYKEQRLVLIGDKAIVVFNDTTDKNKLMVYDGDNPKASFMAVDFPNGEPLLLECQDFVECVRARCIPRVSGDKGLQVLKVLDMCQESLCSVE